MANDEAVCFAVLFFYVLSRHTNIMTDKGYNHFDECAARDVNLFPQEEEWTSSSWDDSKTSGSTAKSQRMLTEINERTLIAKIRIWVESDTVQYQRQLK